MGRFAAGGSAGLVSQFVIYPIETIKTRMMAQINHQSKEKTSFQRVTASNIIRSMYAQGGFQAFYKGVGPSLIGIIPYAGFDLALFETLRVSYMSYVRAQSAHGEMVMDRPPISVILAFGMISGTIAASLLYPLAVIKTR